MKNKTLSFSSFFKYDCFEGNICIRLLYKVYEKKKRMDGKIFAKLELIQDIIFLQTIICSTLINQLIN